ncbi:ITGAE isoform 3, partial [Pan troglodytes]
HPQPILDRYTEPFAIFQLPYEKACKNKLFCVAELQLATTVSQQELVVGLTKELTLSINLTNSGEDSYMTSMALNYPRNLQLKRMQKAHVSVVWQLEENAFPNRTADITVTVTKPSIMYVNTGQGLSHHKQFLFHVHGE